MKKFRLLSIILLVVFAMPKSAAACTCAPPIPKSFFESIQRILTYAPDDTLVSVIKGRIIGVTTNNKGVKVRLLRKYFGRQLSDTITVWGSNGLDCRYSLQSLYNATDTVILAMDRLLYPQNAGESVGDFCISACGYYSLLVRSDSVYGGLVTSDFTGYSLVDLEDSLFRQFHSLTINAGNGYASIAIVYPNPIKDYLTIIGLANGKAALLSMVGQQVAVCDISGNKHELNLSGVVPGAYILILASASGVMRTVRLTKE